MESVVTMQSAPASTPMAALPVMNVFTHELRSPVRVTSSLLNVLSRGYVGELNDRQADLVDRACRRLKVLETLVDDILDLAAGKCIYNNIDSDTVSYRAEDKVRRTLLLFGLRQ